MGGTSRRVKLCTKCLRTYRRLQAFSQPQTQVEIEEVAASQTSA